MKTAVLGGGISGTLTAYYLARHGHDVTLIERGPGVAREASFGNGGLVCPSQSEPWAAPGVPANLLKWLGRDDAPLLLRLHAIPHLWQWGLAFFRNYSRQRHRRNTLTNFRLAQYSARAFAEIRAEADIAYDLLTVGTLKVFLDREAHEQAVRHCETLREHGLAYRVVDGQECAAIEPALAPTAHTLAGGIHFPEDEIGDCFKFAEAIAERCRALGVAFAFDTTVTGLQARGNAIGCVETDRGPIAADRFVVAMGSYTPRVLRRFRGELVSMKLAITNLLPIWIEGERVFSTGEKGTGASIDASEYAKLPPHLSTVFGANASKVRDGLSNSPQAPLGHGAAQPRQDRWTAQEPC